jgi:tetratricopeptide (TPR) repeat protein
VAGLSDIVEETVRASLLDQVGQCQASISQYSAAENTHKNALLLREKRLGKKHIQTLISMHEVGLALSNQGRYKEAEAMYRQTLARREKVLGPKHPDTLMSVYCLACYLTHQHRYEESLVLCDRASGRYKAVLGKDHPTTRACRRHHADALASQEQDQPGISPTSRWQPKCTHGQEVEADARTSKDGH